MDTSSPFCGDKELVVGVHTLVCGVVQVYHELLGLEEEDKGREKVQEIERDNSFTLLQMVPKRRCGK